MTTTTKVVPKKLPSGRVLWKKTTQSSRKKPWGQFARVFLGRPCASATWHSRRPSPRDLETVSVGESQAKKPTSTNVNLGNWKCPKGPTNKMNELVSDGKAIVRWMSECNKVRLILLLLLMTSQEILSKRGVYVLAERFFWWNTPWRSQKWGHFSMWTDWFFAGVRNHQETLGRHIHLGT